MQAHRVEFDHPGSPASPPAPAARRDSSLIRSVNRNLRERSDATAGSERVAFFCECGDAGCYSPLWMSTASFDAVVDAASAWLVLVGHEPSALWHRREPLPVRMTHRARPAGGPAPRRKLNPFGAGRSAVASPPLN